MPEDNSASKTNYQEGEVYFEVTYPDADMCYPKIQTYVFSGHSRSEDGSQVWCFQYVDSFAKFGSILKNAGGDRVAIIKEADELVEILDFAALESVLNAAAERRSLKMRNR